MKLTNEIKIQVYQEAIRNLDEQGVLWGRYSMCDAINAALLNLNLLDTYFKDDRHGTFEYQIPEFVALKPKEVTSYDYWWNRFNKQIRIDNFNKLIKQLKEETT